MVQHFKYLGSTISNIPRFSENHSTILHCIDSKLQLWKGPLLISIAGRRTLVHAVISSIPHYWVGHQTLSKKSAEYHYPNPKEFSLARQQSPFRIHCTRLVSASQVTKPICTGGLGLQDLEFRCGAFHANTLRFFTQPSVMWAQLISQKYLKGQDIRDYNRKPTNSPFWKTLFDQRDLIFNNSKWVVGNGQQSDIFRDHWFQSSVLLNWRDQTVINKVIRALPLGEF